jgi:hypothetical protein
MTDLRMNESDKALSDHVSHDYSKISQFSQRSLDKTNKRLSRLLFFLLHLLKFLKNPSKSPPKSSPVITNHPRKTNSKTFFNLFIIPIVSISHHVVKINSKTRENIDVYDDFNTFV